MSQSLDRLLSCAGNALRTLSQSHSAARPTPLPPEPPAQLDAAERQLSGALMRVNHVGEVCAQALYNAQNLAWTGQRLLALGDRPSLLNPLWYAGAFGIGLLAGRLGPSISLGFVVETERQVEQHLRGHLHRLPARDLASRAIVERMLQDEARHADDAVAAGAAQLPPAVKLAMRLAAKVMTQTAHHL